MLAYQYVVQDLDEDTIELSLPDFPDFCVVSYSEEAALRYAERALTTVIDAWIRIGLDVPRPTGGERRIELSAELSRRLTQYWRSRPRQELASCGEVIDLAAARLRHRAGDAAAYLTAALSDGFRPALS